MISALASVIVPAGSSDVDVGAALSLVAELC